MKQKLEKLGKDLVLRVPDELVRELKLKDEDELEIDVQGNCMCLWYSGVLEELLESGEGEFEYAPGMVELMREQDVDLYK